MIENYVKILELLGDRLEVCVSVLGKCSELDDHFDLCHIFQIRKFDIARLTCAHLYVKFRCTALEFSSIHCAVKPMGR